MLGPRNRASDVAVLLMNGLRNGSVLLGNPEALGLPADSSEKHHPAIRPWIPTLVSVSLAIAFALVIMPAVEYAHAVSITEKLENTSIQKVLHFLTSGPGVLISLPALLLSYHDLVRIVIRELRRHTKD